VDKQIKINVGGGPWASADGPPSGASSADRHPAPRITRKKMSFDNDIK
jgi:hypothetical protein